MARDGQQILQDAQTESPHQEASQSAASQEDDSESHIQEELTTLKEEMANMTKALAKAKDKKKKKKAKDVLWGDSDSSESEPESSSEYESSGESDGSDES